MLKMNICFIIQEARKKEKMKFNRIFLIVCDSLGVGEAKDASSYHDVGANTLGHIVENYPLFVPNLKKLGFLNLVSAEKETEVDAYYTYAKPNNKGKDTLNGHYEMMGVKNDVAFKTFTDTGFPKELIAEIEKVTGRKVIGNKSASGTEIIQELGERQIQYGSLIVYTSGDSVLQVAAHEAIIPVPVLYHYCEEIRKITMKDEWKVGRVIARPFVGPKAGLFKRTGNRKDFALKPPMKSVLNRLEEAKLSVLSIGKIYDIFDGEGITKKIVSASNKEGVDKLLEIMDKKFKGLCFVNLNDFDTLYGHRRDIKGYGNAIEAFDVEIPMILNKLKNDDLLIITADHGNDPSYKGTDHTRENVPVIVYSRLFKKSKELPPLETFADIGATICDNFDLLPPFIGKSFLDRLE